MTGFRSSGERFECRKWDGSANSRSDHPDGRGLWLYTEAVCGRSSDGMTTWTGYVIDVTQRQNLLAPAHRPTVEIARDAGRTLSQLLDDVLDMARARYGRIELRLQHFNVWALFEQVADSQARLIEEKRLSFVRRIEPDAPRTLRCDPLRLKQVLTNLLNNAAKYTEQGTITFSMAPAGRADARRFHQQAGGHGHAGRHLAQPARAARALSCGRCVCRCGFQRCRPRPIISTISRNTAVPTPLDRSSTWLRL
jgi:hypothetical protein